MEQPSEWAELCVDVCKGHAQAVAEFLIDEGAGNGVVEEKSPQDKNRVLLKAYIPNDNKRDIYLNRVAEYLADFPTTEGSAAPSISINVIPDEDWNKKWKSFFQPLKLTERIVIKPSWQNYYPQQGEMVIELDPGMAFGTGTHPSTSMCLKAIDELSSSLAAQPDLRLLDVGTGSGILAIAAVKLGFTRVVGIDIDQTAVRVARKNAEINGVAEAVSFSTTPVRMLEGTYAVVVANILPHVLINMREQLTDRLEAGGFLILSGILIHKAQEVTSAFAGHVQLYNELHEEQWACLVFQKRTIV